MNEWMNEVNEYWSYFLTFYGLEFTCCVVYLNPSNPSQLQVGFPVNKTISYAPS